MRRTLVQFTHCPVLHELASVEEAPA